MHDHEMDTERPEVTLPDAKPPTSAGAAVLILAEAAAAGIAAFVIRSDAHDAGEYSAAVVDLLALLVVTVALMMATIGLARMD